MKNSADEVAVNAVRLAGLLGTKEGIEAAQDALGDTRESVRIAAAAAVGVSLATCRQPDPALLPSTASAAIEKLDAALRAEKAPRVLDALALALDSAMRIPSSSMEGIRDRAASALIVNAERLAKAPAHAAPASDSFFAHAAKALSDALSTQSDPLSDAQKKNAAGIAGDIIARVARRLDAGTLTDPHRQDLGLLADQAELVVKLTLKSRDYHLGDLLRASKDTEFADKAQSVFHDLSQPPFSLPADRFASKP